VASWSISPQNFSHYHIYHILLHCRNSQNHWNIIRKNSSSFITVMDILQVLVRIDSSGLKAIHASQYYTERANLRRKYIKLSLWADLVNKIICTIKIRHTPTRYDNIDFRPLTTKITKMCKSWRFHRIKFHMYRPLLQ
jgi:hypothetical protein